jgi:hypothetical protein
VIWNPTIPLKLRNFVEREMKCKCYRNIEREMQCLKETLIYNALNLNNSFSANYEFMVCWQKDKHNDKNIIATKMKIEHHEIHMQCKRNIKVCSLVTSPSGTCLKRTSKSLEGVLVWNLVA